MYLIACNFANVFKKTEITGKGLSDVPTPELIVKFLNQITMNFNSIPLTEEEVIFHFGEGAKNGDYVWWVLKTRQK